MYFKFHLTRTARLPWRPDGVKRPWWLPKKLGCTSGAYADIGRFWASSDLWISTVSNCQKSLHVFNQLWNPINLNDSFIYLLAIGTTWDSIGFDLTWVQVFYFVPQKLLFYCLLSTLNQPNKKTAEKRWKTEEDFFENMKIFTQASAESAVYLLQNYLIVLSK